MPVLAGDVVGITGNTGRSTGKHLHVSIQWQMRYVDSWLFVNQILLLSTKQ